MKIVMQLTQIFRIERMNMGMREEGERARERESGGKNKCYNKIKTSRESHQNLFSSCKL